MGYDPKGLQLNGQPVAGVRSWVYHDTGGETAAAYAGAGFIADAKDKGAKVADPIMVVDDANDTVYRGRFVTVQDTGGTTGTITLDTGAPQ